MNPLGIATTRLPAKTVTGMTVLFAVLVVAGFLFLYPVLRDAARLDAEIAREKSRLEEQKALVGVYQEFKKLVDQGLAENLPPAKSVPLPKVRVSGVSELFEECAAKSGMEAASITPDPDSLARGGKSLSVRVTLRGEPGQFRDFLAEVGRLPSLETLETIRIQRVSEGFDYQVVAWLALE
jgi:Tfp pilus assembly protein PilO